MTATDPKRPVNAEKISRTVYRLVGTQDDTEKWEFPSGSRVRVEKRDLASGSEVVAVRLAD